VYRLDTFQLETVIAGFEKTITALCWCVAHAVACLCVCACLHAPSARCLQNLCGARVCKRREHTRRSMHDTRIIATTSGEKDIKVWDVDKSQVLPRRRCRCCLQCASSSCAFGHIARPR
jgi:hypothetical protein